MVEFTLLGIPAMFLMISVVEVSLTMWQYHALEYGAVAAARYVITHGSNCSGTCSLTVGNVVTKAALAAVGLDSNKLSVTLKSSSGSTTYSPASSYTSNATTFPPSADSTVGNDVTVTLNYTVNNPFLMYWPGAGKMVAKAVTLQAVSRQRIVF